ncbi:hypothetical protein CSOJ01_15351 [Colletotrichum sojae]|uniref:Uncharacterized protein n=1 Tax=Colletotrichum sojae TaxID=2175907 RepID=A0A8H6MHZ1_9PEZI|nr:hypothetical protein CSOJ01_15351 [Colletotrichum sojae]
MPNAPGDGRPLHLGQPTTSERDHLMDHFLLSPENETYPRPKIETTVNEYPVEAGRSNSEASVTGTWQPKWLRSTVLGAFASLFVAFALALLLLLQYSQRHSGIVAARQSFVYVWRFGPTAVFTIVAAFWARVELQSMRYTPWIALHSRGLSLDEGIATLDYTSMLLPTALVQSLRRKHYVLSLVIVTSIILVAQVALAPGLFNLAAVRVEYATDIQTLDSFDAETRYPDNSTLKTETSAFYMTFGSRRGGVDGSRGTVREPLRAIVDGLLAEVQCLKLKSHTVLAWSEVFHPTPVYSFDVDLHFDGCDKPIYMDNGWITPTRLEAKKGQRLTKNSLSPEIACSGLPQKNTQWVYYAALFGPSPTNASRPAFHKAAALVCTSDAWLEKVEVTDDGISPNVDGQLGTGLITGPVGADWLKNVASDPADPAMYENDILLNSTTNVLKTMIPYLGHYIIRREGAAGAMGTTIATVDRLLVNRWICISMAVLFAFIAVAVFVIIFGYGRSRGKSAWRRDPATIFGSMSYLQDHPELFQQLPGLETKKPLVDWDQCNYSPPALKGYFRALSTMLIIGVIAGLIVAHEISASFDGIASIDEEGYTHLLWTSVPSLTMLCISLYMASCNTTNRSLCTFHALASQPCRSRELDYSLLDMVGVRSLYRSIRLKCYTVSMSQFLALACGLLTTFASVLFTGKYTLPRHASALFPQETWLGTQRIQPVETSSFNIMRARRSLSGLLMRQGETSLNYPRNTYYDLVFPSLGGMQDIAGLSQTLSVNMTMPAAQLISTCKKLSEGDDYRVVFGGRKEHASPFIRDVELFKPYTCPNGTRVELRDGVALERETNPRGRVYVGQALRSVNDLADVNAPCSLRLNASELRLATKKHETYLWGEYVNGTKFSESISVYSCAYEWTEVTTKVHFVPVDGALIVDPENPPQPDDSARRPWNHLFAVSQEDAIPQIIMPEKFASLESKFAVLIQPYGRFTMEDLGNASKEEEILDALRGNVGFITAQIANIENRLALNASSLRGPPPAEGFPPVNATIFSEGDYRLVQNTTATYVLVGILSAVVLFNLWALLSAALRRSALSESRLLAMDVKGLAPEGFNSFAALGSLLRGSNVSSHLMPGAHLLSNEELHEMHSHLSFRLGWFRYESDQSRHFSIGVLGDETFTFLGRKK